MNVQCSINVQLSLMIMIFNTTSSDDNNDAIKIVTFINFDL